MFCQNLLPAVFPFGMSHFSVSSAYGISLNCFSGILSCSVIFHLSLWIFVNNVKHLPDLNHSLRTQPGSSLFFFVYTTMPSTVSRML